MRDLAAGCAARRYGFGAALVRLASCSRSDSSVPLLQSRKLYEKHDDHQRLLYHLLSTHVTLRPSSLSSERMLSLRLHVSKAPSNKMGS